MPLVQPKYRVRTPNESLNSHATEILRLSQVASHTIVHYNGSRLQILPRCAG
jgi:hypothetical protein